MVVFGVMLVFHLAAGSGILTYILAATVCAVVIKQGTYLTIIYCHLLSCQNIHNSTALSF